MIGPVRDRQTFARLARGRRHRHGPVVMTRVRDADAEARGEPAQVAYRVGRRVGNAVARNLVRRRLRAAMARHADHLAPGSAYLVTAQPAAGSASFATLEHAVGRLVRDLAEDVEGT